MDTKIAIKWRRLYICSPQVTRDKMENKNNLFLPYVFSIYMYNKQDGKQNHLFVICVHYLYVKSLGINCIAYTWKQNQTTYKIPLALAINV